MKQNKQTTKCPLCKEEVEGSVRISNSECYHNGIPTKLFKAEVEKEVTKRLDDQRRQTTEEDKLVSL